MNFRLGQVVSAPDTLVRWHDYKNHKMTKTWIRHGERQASEGFYVNNPGPKAALGVVVGIRHLHETGTVIYNYEEQNEWHAKGKKRTAVLISTNLYLKPVLAWIEDVKDLTQVDEVGTL